jgi:tryptophan synthase alpha subunit
LGGLVDAAVVGSALVSEIEKATATNSSAAAIDVAVNALADRIRSLKSAARTGLSRREVAT